MEETTCGELEWGYWGPGPLFSGIYGGMSALLFDRTVETDATSNLREFFGVPSRQVLLTSYRLASLRLGR